MSRQRPIPPEAWGVGCALDHKNNRLYGADGIVYNNVEIRKSDLIALIAAIKRRREQGSGSDDPTE